MHDKIVCLSTSASANKDIVDDLLAAEDKGKEAYETFKRERIEGDKNFHLKMTKLNLKTFSHLSKEPKSVKLKEREIILKVDRNLFSSIIICAKSRAMSMEDVFCHPLGPLPWALAKPEGLLYKTVKAALGQKVVNSVPPSEQLPVPRATIIDGMAIVNKLKCDKQTFESISDSILERVLHDGPGSKRIDVVFDVYRDVSIKQFERKARVGNEKIVTYSNLQSDSRVLKWNLFLLGSQNKACLVDFVFEQ